MDSPKAMQKISRIIDTSVGPGVKPSSPARCPSWKIHTSAPNTAVSESVLRARALPGRPPLTAAKVSISAAAEPPTSAVLGRGPGRLCHAYLDVAVGHPNLYRVLFERHRREAVAPGTNGANVTTIIGADAYGVLLDAVRACVEAGDSAGNSAEAAAVRVWVSLPGMVTLRASLPWLPGPPRDTLLDELVQRAADLHP